MHICYTDTVNKRIKFQFVTRIVAAAPLLRAVSTSFNFSNTESSAKAVFDSELKCFYFLKFIQAME